MRIQLLSKELANQIAAGEVIERPASVLKELIENSIDAGATQIDIMTELSGQKRIVVRDNGRGIPEADLELALTRHATSKLSSFDELMNIKSLGFRGEALASIASIAHVVLSSCTAEQSLGSKISLDSSNNTHQQFPVSHPVGTTIEVVDLFYNTPARKKFLKSTKAEQAAIMQVLDRFAVCYPEIGFSYISNGVQLFSWRPVKCDPPLKRYADVLGEIKSFAHDVFFNATKCKVKGILFTADAPEKFNKLQWFFVNGRAVRDKILLHALKSSYNEPLGALLFIDCCPSLVDVNVHPTKHEVRFQDNRYMHDLIKQAILKSLSHKLVEPLLPSYPQQTISALQYSATSTIPHVVSSHLRPSAEAVGIMNQNNAVSLLQPTMRASSEALHYENSVTTEEPRGWHALGWIHKDWFFCTLENELVLSSVPKLLNAWVPYYYQLQMTSVKRHTLLFPYIINLSEKLGWNDDALEALLKALDKRGFTVERLGQDDLRCRDVPDLVPRVGSAPFLTSFFNALLCKDTHVDLYKSNLTSDLDKVIMTQLCLMTPVDALDRCSALEMRDYIKFLKHNAPESCRVLSSTALEALFQDEGMIP